MVVSFKPSEWAQIASQLEPSQITAIRAEVMRLTGVTVETDEDILQFTGRFTVEVPNG